MGISLASQFTPFIKCALSRRKQGSSPLGSANRVKHLYRTRTICFCIQKAIAIAACVRVLGTPLFQKWCVAKDRPQADCSRQGADVIEDAFVASSNLAPAIACFHSRRRGFLKQ